MLQRCFNPRHPRYRDYGDRGVRPGEDWLSYVNFYADVLDPPPGLSLNRFDNDGGYVAQNCGWATPKEQVRNRRRPRKRKRKNKGDRR